MTYPRHCTNHQRRQAQPYYREAAGQHSCVNRINAPVLAGSPPHPPQQRLRRFLGTAWQAGGRFGPFLQKGRRGEPQKPVDCVGCNYVPSGSAKRSAAFAIIKPPHIGCFLPHILPFLPHARFCGLALLYLSIYLFSEREERKERRESQKQRSTLLKTVTKVYPRIFCVSTGFWWMADRAVAQCLRGFQGFLGVVHTSTRGNALGRALASAQEVTHA